MHDVAQPTVLVSCVSVRNNIGLNPADPVPAITGHTVSSPAVPVGRLCLNVGKKIVLYNQEDVSTVAMLYVV